MLRQEIIGYKIKMKAVPTEENTMVLFLLVSFQK